jgi:hypothetical protein
VAPRCRARAPAISRPSFCSGLGVCKPDQHAELQPLRVRTPASAAPASGRGRALLRRLLLHGHGRQLSCSRKAPGATVRGRQRNCTTSNCVDGVCCNQQRLRHLPGVQQQRQARAPAPRSMTVHWSRTGCARRPRAL